MLFPELDPRTSPVQPRFIHLVVTLDLEGRPAAVQVDARTVQAELLLSQAFFPWATDLGHPEPLRACLGFAQDLVGPPLPAQDR